MAGTTWEAYAAGRVLVGQSATDSDFTAGKTGGTKTVTLKQENLPSRVVVRTQAASPSGDSTPHSSEAVWNNHSLADSGERSDVPFSVMQPYTVVYFWRRTA